MKRIEKLKWMVMMSIFLAVIFGTAYAGNIALRGGYTTTGYDTGMFTFDSGSAGTTVNDQSSNPLAIGRAVQCFWIGPNGNINDPVPGSDEVHVGGLKYCGDDSDTWNIFSQAGKFYHDYSASGAEFTSGAGMYFRVWDNAVPQAGGAVFGESNIVNAAYDANIVPLPFNHGLTNMVVQFTQAAPASPTLGTVTPNQASPGGSPTIQINANSAVHGRWYDFDVSAPALTSGGPFTFGYMTALYENGYHAADVNTGSTRSRTITLGQSDDDKWVKVRIRAANDYGASGWTESGPIYIPATADPYIPVAVTDLQATLEGKNVTLSWTAPYDKNKYGTQTTCVEYDIRVSNEAIVNDAVDPFTPGTTNPLGTTTWNNAQNAATYFTTAPVVPVPSAFGVRQSYRIANISQNGTFYFAVKSKDGSGNWSYISNVAGVQLGTPTASTETMTFTFTRAAGGVGINMLSIPFGFPLVQPVIGTLYELVREINIQAGDNVVYSIGWWDAATKKPAGYEINYNTLTINDFRANPTTGLPPLSAGFASYMPIVRDKSYQINVVRNSTFTIKGIR
jgi:hypothetical protein